MTDIQQLAADLSNAAGHILSVEIENKRLRKIIADSADEVCTVGNYLADCIRAGHGISGSKCVDPLTDLHAKLLSSVCEAYPKRDGG